MNHSSTNLAEKSDALATLRVLHQEHVKQKFPNFPSHALPKKTYSARTSNGLTKCIIDFLNFSGHQAERVSNTGRLIDNRETVIDVIGRSRMIGSTKWLPSSGRNGTADISACIAGRAVKIEIKIGSPAQVQYQRSVEAAGGIYFIARSFKDFLSWYQSTFSHGKES